MKIEKGIISSSQLMFLIIGLLEASTLTAAFISGITKQNTWLVLLLGMIAALPLLLVYTSISSKFPDKNLIEINDVIYGRYVGKIISVLYIYYFWFIIPANTRFISDFFSTYLFQNTDIIVFVLSFAVVRLYAVRKGIEVIARAGSVISILTIVSSVTITVLTIGNVKLSNFLPLFQISLKELIQGINLMIAIPFGEIIVFQMIFPYVNDKSQVKKSVFAGLFIGSAFFLNTILRNTAVLGNISSIHVLPSYQVARLINIGEIITRMEILIALNLLFNVFMKACIFHYATVLSLAQLLRMRTYKPLVIPVGLISSVFTISMYSSQAYEAYTAANIYSIYVLSFIVFIPIISLITAHVRKLN